MIIITNLGSRNAPMTAYLHKKSVWIGTGCFIGTADKFLDQVDSVHKDNDHAKAYHAAVEFAKQVLKH